MSNRTCDVSLSSLFPQTASLDTNATRLDGNASGIVVQAVPSAVVALAWGILEASRRRRAFSRAFRTSSLVMGVAALAAQTVLVWHLFDLLRCADEEGDATTTTTWQYVATVAAPLTDVALLFVVGARLPRIGILLFLALAAATVFADWALRGGLAERADAAAPLVPIQQLFALLTVVSFARLPGRRHAATSSSGLWPRWPRSTPPKKLASSELPVVDALTVRESRAATNAADASSSSSRGAQWSWFTSP